MAYTEFYRAQSGSGLDYVSNPPWQRGYGLLGNMFKSLTRSALPLLKSGASYLGKQLLNTGAEVASDIAAGGNFSDSVKQRGKEVLEGIQGDAKRKFCQSGSGRKRKRTVKKKAAANKKRKIVKKKTIFEEDDGFSTSTE